MKKILLLITLLALSVLPAFGQLTQISAAALSIGSTPVTGTVCAIAVDINDNPINVAIGSNLGIQGAGESCGNVVAGAITTSVEGGAFTVADAALAGNPGFNYNFIVTDSTSKQLFNLRQVPNVQGSVYNLDHFIPAITVPTVKTFTFTTGSGAPSMACSGKAFYQNISTASAPVLYQCGADLAFHIITSSGGGSGISALTGDAAASGTGSVALTLATVNSNVGSCGDATHTSQVTLDAKGRATSCTPVPISASVGSGSIIPSPQFRMSFFPNVGTSGAVQGDSGSTTDGNGNVTHSSIFTGNHSMTGLFNQVSSMSGFNHQVENDGSTTDAFGNSETGAVLLYAHNWGVGKNVGPAFGTSVDGWRTLTTLWVKGDSFSSGIHQLVHLTGNFAGSGDSAIIYAGNAEGFTPAMWTTSADEGVVGYMLNGTQNACIANGTITSTIGVGDRNPVFNITPVNCNGAQTLINDGVIIDTSVTVLHTALTGTISSVWESNPFQIGSLPVTPGTATPSTGMCITTAPIVQSTVPGTYQTQSFSCTVHDSHPLHAGAVILANSGGPEQCNVITASGSGTQTGTISCAKYHQAGAYIFQGGTQGFGDFDDDMDVVGLHSVVWTLGAPDADHVLIAHRIAGAFRGDSLPYRGAEPAGLTVTGGFTVHPGALCVNTNSTNSQCGLEFNTIAWGAGHTFSSPTGIPSVEVMGSFNSTQSAPDSPQSGGYGLNVNFYSNTQHGTGHPFLGLGNFAPLSRYANTGVGTGYLSGPPGIEVHGAMGNFGQFDMSLAPFAGEGNVPCGGATLLCNKNGLHTFPVISLYKDWQGPEAIVLDGPNSQFRFRGWDVVVENNLTSNTGTFSGTLSAPYININNVGNSNPPLRMNEQYVTDNLCKGEYFNQSGADYGRICANHTNSGGDEFNLVFDIGNNSSSLARALTLKRDASNNMHAIFAGDISANLTAGSQVNSKNICLVDGTNCPSVQLRLLGTTGSIGGASLTAGTCATGTATVTGAVVGHPVGVSASNGTLPSPLVVLAASVTATNTVSVQVCAIAAVTPTAVTYNVSTY